MSDFCDYTKPKARRCHICTDCGITIKSGENYHKWRGMFDGEFYEHKQCALCHEVEGILGNGSRDPFDLDYKSIDELIDYLYTGRPLADIPAKVRSYMMRVLEWERRDIHSKVHGILALDEPERSRRLAACDRQLAKIDREYSQLEEVA